MVEAAVERRDNPAKRVGYKTLKKSLNSDYTKTYCLTGDKITSIPMDLLVFIIKKTGRY